MANTSSMIAELEKEGNASPVIEGTIAQYLQMQSVCQMGMAMCRYAEDGDFESLSELYVKRDQALNDILQAREALRISIQRPESKKTLNTFFEPVLQAIGLWDERLITILKARKDYIVEKSKEAQLHRLIAKYLV